MGRIKTQLTKRLSFEIIEKHRDKMAKDFEQNKKAVDAVLKGSSKKVRNTIAGYVTRLMKIEEI